MLAISRAPPTGQTQQPGWVRFLGIGCFLSTSPPPVGGSGEGQSKRDLANCHAWLRMQVSFYFWPPPIAHVRLVGVQGASRNEDSTNVLLMPSSLVPPVPRLGCRGAWRPRLCGCALGPVPPPHGFAIHFFFVFTSPFCTRLRYSS